MPAAGEVEVFIVDLDACELPISGYEMLLSQEEKARAAGFRFPSYRDRYLRMHGILRTLLSPVLGVDAREIVFNRNEYGKPYVPGGCEFNISYSANRGLIGTARVPIGVDIERIDPDKVTPEMIEDVFSPGERSSFFPEGLLSPAHVRTFFRGWVRKESVIKAMGTGVSFPLKLVRSGLGREISTASYDGVEYTTCGLEGCGAGFEAAITVAADNLPKVTLRNP